jgi:hypothetical protein
MVTKNVFVIVNNKSKIKTKMEIKLLFKYEEPKTIGEHKVIAIRQVPRGIRFRTENGPVLKEVAFKETWTEEELHALLLN